MVGVSTAFDSVFAGVQGKSTKIYRSGRDNIDATRLAPEEQGAVNGVLDQLINGLTRVNGAIAANVANQRGLALAFASVAKAKIPNGKNISYPSQTGGLGIVPLLPQWFNYSATASASNPSYTSYSDNTWNISTTAGTAAYIMGDGTNYYKGKPTDDNKVENFVFDKGLIEVGLTPKADQFRIWSQNETKYGVYAEHPLYDQPIDADRPIYQHDTPLGAMILTHDFGFQWKFMPTVTGTINLRLLGLSVYEHDFANDLIYTS